jgi:REP element-mobilizing transposase RayT
MKGFDYSQSGFYFITICTQDRIDRFGKIENGKMIVNDAGKMVQSVWTGLPLRFPSIKLDAFQIMPNHIHGIIQITKTTVGTPLVGVRNATNTHNVANSHDSAINENISPDGAMVARNAIVDVAVNTAGDKTGVCFELGRGRTGTRPVRTGVADDNPEETLGNIVGAFKSIITRRYCNGVKMGLVSSFNKRLFQHRFHDHIIRNENVLFRIRQYIQNNPSNWHNDKMKASNNNTVQEIVANYGEESWMV